MEFFAVCLKKWDLALRKKMVMVPFWAWVRERRLLVGHKSRAYLFSTKGRRRGQLMELEL
jgi:hypothetical protein